MVYGVYDFRGAVGAWTLGVRFMRFLSSYYPFSFFLLLMDGFQRGGNNEDDDDYI